MRNVLGAVDAGELRRLLERSAEEAHEAAVLADHDAISTSTGVEWDLQELYLFCCNGVWEGTSLVPRLPPRALTRINRESFPIYFRECTWGEPGNEARKG